MGELNEYTKETLLERIEYLENKITSRRATIKECETELEGLLNRQQEDMMKVNALKQTLNANEPNSGYTIQR